MNGTKIVQEIDPKDIEKVSINSNLFFKTISLFLEGFSLLYFYEKFCFVLHIIDKLIVFIFIIQNNLLVPKKGTFTCMSLRAATPITRKTPYKTAIGISCKIDVNNTDVPVSTATRREVTLCSLGEIIQYLIFKCF